MFPQLGPMELIVVMAVAVLLFGKRLPEVGRSLGRGLVEFKKGIRGDEVDDYHSSYAGTSNSSNSYHASSTSRLDDPFETTVPKFEPPQATPRAHAAEGEARPQD